MLQQPILSSTSFRLDEPSASYQPALASQNPQVTPPPITVDFVKRLHKRLLDGHNIDTDSDDGVWTASMIPKGIYHRVPCFTTHKIGETINATARYCPPSTIEQEMTWVLEQVQAIQDKDDIDPFRTCAWIQWTFVRIHPFADGNGNGRVARLLSSARLVRCGLPPVYVEVKIPESRDGYRHQKWHQRSCPLSAIGSFRSAWAAPSLQPRQHGSRGRGA